MHPPMSRRVPHPGPTPSAAVLRASFGQVLLRAARLFNERAITRLQREREPRIRLAHTALFPHLDAEGVRPGVLARKVGSSKQAVAALLGDLEEWGIVERIADPADRRARLVRWTARGGAAIHDGLATLAAVEAELATTLGAERLDAVRLVLADIADLLAGEREGD